MSSLALKFQIPRTVTARKEVPFGEWMPDLPSYNNPGATVANGVIPKATSYGPVAGLTNIYTALTARCLGAVSARDASNNIYLYAGDAAKLYEGVNNTFTDQSIAAGYTVAADDVWEFAIDHKNAIIIATNGTDAIQSIGIGLGSSTAFAIMATSTEKPKAKHVAIVKDFIVIGNTTYSDGHKPFRVGWSGIGPDQTDFDPDATTQSDYQDLAEGGWVQKIVGGAEYGVIFQNELIRRMEYVGSPLVFSFPAVDRHRGTNIPGSVVGFGRNIFFISDEGFFRFDGTGSIPIGANKVDKTFWNQFDISNKRAVSAAIDLQNKLVAWVFPGSGSTGSLPNKIYFYQWDQNRWSEADIDTEWVIPAATQGYTLESLDNVLTGGGSPGGGAAASGVDTVGAASFDSDVWKGGQFRFSAFDQDHKLSYFTGSNLAATLETGEFTAFPGRRARVRSIRPEVDGGTLTVAVAGRQLLTATATYDTAASINSIGECSVDNSARYHRARVSIAAGGTWTHAQGVEATVAVSARR